MLQDVRNTRLVWRIGLESNREDVVPIIASKVKIFSTCSIMLKLESCKLQFWNVLQAFEGESV